MKLLVLHLFPAKVILYNGSYLSVTWVITWFRNFILICPLFVSSSILFSFQATGIIISMPLLFWRWNIFFITSTSTWCIAFSKYTNKSSGGDPVIMWTFLCITHSGERVKSSVQRLGIYEKTQPPRLEEISHRHILLSFRASIRGDGPFQVITTTKRCSDFKQVG